MRQKAVLYLRKNLSAERQERDLYEMRTIAYKRGYDIARTLTIGRHVQSPILSLLNTINHVRAAAVVIPALEHLDRAERAITENCDLIAAWSETVWPRGFRWPSSLPAPPRLYGGY